MGSLTELARGAGALAELGLSNRPASILLNFFSSLKYRGSSADVYNVLWAVVFGFATLNILSLASRHLEPRRRGLNFGEVLAVTVVLLSVFLLGWELLGIFHIFPIKLKR